MKTVRQFLFPLLLFSFFSSASFAVDTRNISEWNLPDNSLAIQGHDPVAYFPEGGSKPMMGNAKLELKHQGVLYRFATKENMDLFLSTPQKYEVAYGGWCATAMAMDMKIDILPHKFLIKGDRLFLFSLVDEQDAKVMWEMHPTSLEVIADTNWLKMSGESARGLPTIQE